MFDIPIWVAWLLNFLVWDLYKGDSKRVKREAAGLKEALSNWQRRWQLFHISKLNVCIIFIVFFLKYQRFSVLASHQSYLWRFLFNRSRMKLGICIWSIREIFPEASRYLGNTVTVWKMHIHLLKMMTIVCYVTLILFSNFNSRLFSWNNALWMLFEKVKLNKNIWFVQKLKGRC